MSPRGQSAVGGLALGAIALSLSEPVLGPIIAADGNLDFPSDILLGAFSAFLFLCALHVFFWNRRMPILGYDAKKGVLWIVTIYTPVFLFSVVEAGLTLMERVDVTGDLADRQATVLIAQSGKRPEDYKGINLYPQSDDPLFTVNETGFRTYPFGETSTEDTRIMMLGGSTVFGWKVADAHVLSRLLENELETRLEKRPRVFNMGVPAASFAEEVALLADFAPVVKPNLVIFYHGSNDGMAWYHAIRKRSDTKQSLRSDASVPNYLYAKISQFRLFWVLSDLLGGRKQDRNRDTYDFSDAIDEYRRNLERAADVCNRIPCVFFLQPNVFHKSPKTINELKIQTRARSRWPDLGLVYDRFIDLIMSSDFSNHIDLRGSVSDATSTTFFFDYIHATPAGNRRIAAAIGDALCDNAYLRCR